MKTTNIKSIYFTKYELKDALVDYIENYVSDNNEQLAKQVLKGECEMKWVQDSEEFVITINEEFTD
jgi:hypothetical protein